MINIRKPNKDSFKAIIAKEKETKDPLAKAIWLLVLSKTYRIRKGL